MTLNQIENSYTDIFTETDDSIFIDGSIDPLGLRMIWTSLGNAIFKNKLNTISTNSKFYTLNLFHHSVIRELHCQYPEHFINQTGKAPYHSKIDLFDGMIIFLECLIAHVLVQERQWGEAESHNGFFIPGLSKLRTKIDSAQREKITDSIPVSRSEGILVRHILLGIHGRHKGPFQQMGFLNRFDYYHNDLLWDEVRDLFNNSQWKQLRHYLSELLLQKILTAKISASKPIWVKIKDDIINTQLRDLYTSVLQEEQFRIPALVNFWEKNLGISDDGGTAALIYQAIKEKKGNAHAEQLIIHLQSEFDRNELRAICTIEPFITLHNKVMSRLLQRGVSNIDDSLKKFVYEKLDSHLVNTNQVREFLLDRFFNVEAIRRLRDLIQIYEESKNPIDEVRYIHNLIGFHNNVMKQRGNLPWLSIGNNGEITQHRSFYYSDEYQKNLKDNHWVNDYYVSTVVSLYKGLYEN
jgi:hypothetical protein